MTDTELEETSLIVTSELASLAKFITVAFAKILVKHMPPPSSLENANMLKELLCSVLDEAQDMFNIAIDAEIAAVQSKATRPQN